MSALSITSRLDRARLGRIADWLSVAVAVSIPWSTSATSILLVLWLIVLIPTLKWSDLRSELLTAVGGLPVALFLLGAAGMLWADVSWHDRWGGLDGFVRLLVIPLLMVQFRRSDGGYSVLAGFLISCIALLIASFVVTVWPNLHPRPAGNEGVPVKSYIVQSLEFTMCAAVLLDFAAAKARLRQWKIAAAFAVLALAFLGDIFFVTTGRTALVVIPVLVLLYGFRQSGWKGIFAAGAAGCIIAAVVWTASPYVRERVTGIYTESELYEQKNEPTPSGLRIDFWKQSLRFIASAPLFGHGTGSIVDQFERAASRRAEFTFQAIPITRHLRSVSNSALWELSFSGRCGYRTCCCFEEPERWHGSARWSWRRTSSAPCSTRLFSISLKVGSTYSAWVWWRAWFAGKR